jgi:3-hydroxybutyryl-CoA dehydrogenase
MRLVVLTNEELKEEFLSGGISDDVDIDWIKSVDELHGSADAIFDLLFEENNYETSHLKGFSPKPIFVNSVNKPISEIGIPVIRLNAWPGFLKRSIAEASCADESLKETAEKILAGLNKKTEWVPDVRGFVSARVISMIINEAYFALEENVSTKDEIDIAMKLGTNYPYGPFEWTNKIGLKNIVSLLTELSLSEKRYQPAGLLLKEAIE